MNNAELIKALRNCACVTENVTCADCEYYKKQLCKRSMMIDAADAIERLTANVDRNDKAIERMRDLMRHYKAAYRTAYKLYQEARNEHQP